MKRKSLHSCSETRIVAHIDLDCFYVQVERSINASLKNKPVGVVQYNPFGDLKSYLPSDNRIVTTGSLIAVSYEARAKGVKRTMRGAEATKICPDMVLVQVPTSHGKADLGIYREASARILTVLAERYGSNIVVERASIDEVFVDVSLEAEKLLESSDPHTFLPKSIATLIASPSLIAGDDTQEMLMSKAQISKGHNGTEMMSYASSTSVTNSLHTAIQASTINNSSDKPNSTLTSSWWFKRPAYEWSLADKLLLAGALVVDQLRKDVYHQLGFTCSAGVAMNKMLAKISSAMHKPNKQTLVPISVVTTLIPQLPYTRIPGLGGKLGYALETQFGTDTIKTMGDIMNIPKKDLVQAFGEETTLWLHNVCRGLDDDPVLDRSLPVSIGCSKSFRSTNMLRLYPPNNSTTNNNTSNNINSNTTAVTTTRYNSNNASTSSITASNNYNSNNNNGYSDSSSNSVNNNVNSNNNRNGSNANKSNNIINNNNNNNPAVLYWLTELAEELLDRVSKDTVTNSRIPKNLQAGASVKIFTIHTTTHAAAADDDDVTSIVGKSTEVAERVAAADDDADDKQLLSYAATTDDQQDASSSSNLYSIAVEERIIDSMIEQNYIEATSTSSRSNNTITDSNNNNSNSDSNNHVKLNEIRDVVTENTNKTRNKNVSDNGDNDTIDDIEYNSHNDSDDDIGAEDKNKTNQGSLPSAVSSWRHVIPIEEKQSKQHQQQLHPPQYQQIEGFSLSKVCPFVNIHSVIGNCSSSSSSSNNDRSSHTTTNTTNNNNNNNNNPAGNVARRALNMLCKSIYEHPRTIAATTQYSSTSNNSSSSGSNCSNNNNNNNIGFLVAVTGLSLGATNFQTIESGSKSITTYFKTTTATPTSPTTLSLSTTTAKLEEEGVKIEIPSMETKSINSHNSSSCNNISTNSREQLNSRSSSNNSNSSITPVTPPLSKKVAKPKRTSAVKSMPSSQVGVGKTARCNRMSDIYTMKSNNSEMTNKSNMNTAVGIAMIVDIENCSSDKDGNNTIDNADNVISYSSNNINIQNNKDNNNDDDDDYNVVVNKNANSVSQSISDNIYHQHEIIDLEDSDDVVDSINSCSSSNTNYISSYHNIGKMTEKESNETVKDSKVSLTIIAVSERGKDNLTDEQQQQEYNSNFQQKQRQQQQHCSQQEHQPNSMLDIDPAVFLTLPPDIQREIELTMRLRQHQQQQNPGYQKQYMEQKQRLQLQQQQGNAINGTSLKHNRKANKTAYKSDCNILNWCRK